MHPLMIVLGAALLDIGANMAINRSLGFRHKGWGLLGILLVLCAFTLLSEAVSTGRIDLAVAYATWGAIGILGTALGGLLLFGERLHVLVEEEAAAGFAAALAGLGLGELAVARIEPGLEDVFLLRFAPAGRRTAA